MKNKKSSFRKIIKALNRKTPKKGRSKRSTNKRPVIIAVAAVIIAVLVILGINMGKDAMTLLDNEKNLKAEIKSIASCLRSGDIDGAEKSTADLDLTLSQTGNILAEPAWKAAEKVIVVGRDISTVRSLIGIAQDCSDNIIKPTIAVMREYPIKQNNGQSDSGTLATTLSAANEYISLAEQIIPYAQRCADEIRQLPHMRISRLEDKMAEIRTYADLAGSFLPVVGDDIVPIARDAADSIFSPLAETLRDTPLPENMHFSFSDIQRVDEQTSDTYLALAQELLPHLCDCLSRIHSVMTDNMSDLDYLDPELKEKLINLEALIPFAEDALRDLAPSAISVLKENPIAELLPGNGKINVVLLSNYLDYAQQIMPTLKEYDQRFGDAEPYIDENVTEKLQPVMEKLDKAIALYDRAEQHLPLIRTIIGSGEDRFYLLVAQNSAEIRAAGGFPGSVGTIEVKNGVLSVGDFSSVYDVLPGYTDITPVESALFRSHASAVRDAEFNPYYPRIAQIWAVAYEMHNNHHVDGVISLTPLVIQEILGITGEITLSDGTLLDGVNATWVLQNGLYKHYMQRYDSYYNDLTDALFAETAKLAMNQALSHIGLSNLNSYVSIFEECRDKRIIMIWMADRDEQSIVEQAKCDGSFNTDPSKPQVGVFLNNYTSCKMGWYVDMDIAIGTGVKNEDSSYSYPVTVTVMNTMSPEERNCAGYYILGKDDGAMKAILYFVAPAGGALGDFASDDSCEVWRRSYMGSEISYTDVIEMPIGSSATFSFTVTTAPGEQEPLTAIHTPFAMERRTDGCEYGIAGE